MHNSGSISHQHGSQRATAAYIKYQMTLDFILLAWGRWWPSD